MRMKKNLRLRINQSRRHPFFNLPFSVPIVKKATAIPKLARMTRIPNVARILTTVGFFEVLWIIGSSVEKNLMSAAETVSQCDLKNYSDLQNKIRALFIKTGILIQSLLVAILTVR